jgi:hypothetical protein
VDSRICIDWLRKKNLLDTCKTYSTYLKGVFKDCLRAKNESILIIGDTGYDRKRAAAMLAGSYYFAAKKLGLHPRLFFQMPKLRGDLADKSIVDAIDYIGERSIIILSMSNKLGHLRGRIKGYRKYCEKKGIKFVTTPSLGNLETKHFSSLLKTININYPEIQRNHRLVKSVLERGTELHVRTRAGTDLHMKIDPTKIKSADGNYTKYGTGGNLPAGEVYFPPKKKSVNGKVVIDGSSRNRQGTTIIKNPITLIIKNGDLIDIQGKEEARILEQTLLWAERNSKYPWGIRKVCEFGIGLNPKARVIGSTIIDEKALGTAHIALGSNNWFGGSIFAMTHLDQVFRNPKITVDGKLLNI